MVVAADTAPGTGLARATFGNTSAFTFIEDVMERGANWSNAAPGRNPHDASINSSVTPKAAAPLTSRQS
jgi:hypothetical protein